MRAVVLPMILPFAAWLSALQALSGSVPTLDGSARLAGIAGVLGTLTVLVYRLGVWRKEMESRLDTLDHLVTEAKEFNQQALRRHRRTARRLERLEEQAQ